jgi:hypothetical protein
MDRQVLSSGEKRVDVPTVRARQGAGPRDLFAVLLISLLLAAAVGIALLAYFVA